MKQACISLEGQHCFAQEALQMDRHPYAEDYRYNASPIDKNVMRFWHAVRTIRDQHSVTYTLSVMICNVTHHHAQLRHQSRLASSWTFALAYPVSTPEPGSSALTGFFLFPSAPELVCCVCEAPFRRFRMKNTASPTTANTNNGTTTPIAAFTPAERSGFGLGVIICVRDDVVDVNKVCCLIFWICCQPPTWPSVTRDREVLTYVTVTVVTLVVKSILLVDIEVPVVVVLCKVLLDIDPIANRPSGVELQALGGKLRSQITRK